MPKEILKGYQINKKRDIDIIMKIIKENNKIKSNILLAKLTMGFPYLNQNKALEYIRGLKLIDKIKINDNDEVSLCQ